MKRVNNTLYDIIDSHTGENFNYDKVTTFSDGSAMNDAKCDGVIYRKLGSEYFKRNFTGAVNVRWFGAKGDGVTDDYETIQGVIDKCSNGFLSTREIFMPAGLYLISDSLRMGNRVSLFGESPGGFPYFAGQDNHTIIEARFGLNQDKYIIDSFTKNVDGDFYSINEFPNASELFSNPTNQFIYNINIKNLYLRSDSTAVANATYGGIRLIGTPASQISSVSVLNTKVGFTLCSQWGSYVQKCFSLTHWYGAIFSKDMNGNHLQGYFNRVDDPIPLVKCSLIPAASDITGVYELDGNSIENAYIGIILNTDVRATTIDVIIEHWEIGVFEIDAIGTLYSKLYLEGGVLKYALSSAYSSSNIQGFQCYSTNDLCYGFDFGFNSRSHINATGLRRTNAGLIKKIVTTNVDGNLTKIVIEGETSINLPDSERVVVLDDVTKNNNINKVLAKLSFTPGPDFIIKSSFNIGSIVREAIGQYIIYFSNQLPNINYSPILTSNDGCFVGIKNDGIQVYSLQIVCRNVAGDFVDPQTVSLVIH